MKSLLTKTSLIVTPFLLQAFFLLLITSPAISIAQSYEPMRALTPIAPIEADEPDNDFVSFIDRSSPSLPLFLDTIGETELYAVEKKPSEFITGAVEIIAKRSQPIARAIAPVAAPKEATFAIEPADMNFEIGKEVDFEGLRVANIDPDGHAILMEDLVKPVLYIRFQKITTGYINTTLYNEAGILVLSKKTMNIMCGTEFELDYSQWPEGAYLLHVRLDNGTKWIKKIVKTEATVSNF